MAEERQPYLQVELDAIHKADQVARAARAQGHQLSRNDILGGLLDLWEGCWRRKSREVTQLMVMGCFGSDITTILMEYGFLALESGTLRVRGAGKYLHLAEGRKKGGEAAKNNLIPGPHKKRVSRKAAGVGAGEKNGQPEGNSSGSSPALSGISSSQHSAYSSLKTHKQLECVPPGPEEGETALSVFEHYKATFRKPYASFDEDKDLILKRLREGNPLERLKKAINGLAKDKWSVSRSVTALKNAIGSAEVVARCCGWDDNPREDIPAKGRASEADKDWTRPKDWEVDEKGNVVL